MHVFKRHEWNVLAEAHKQRSLHAVGDIPAHERNLGGTYPNGRDRHLHHSTEEAASSRQLYRITPELNALLIANDEVDWQSRSGAITFHIDRHGTIPAEDGARARARQEIRDRVEKRSPPGLINQN